MNKIIIVFCAVMAVAYAHAHAHDEDNVDNFIKSNRDQYQRVLNSHDLKLANFLQDYEKRIQAVAFQKDLVVSSIVHTNARLTPLTMLNDFAKQCVLQYNVRIPSVEKTTESISQCELAVTTPLNTLLNGAVEIRNALQNHISTDFEKEVVKCGKDYAELPANYTSCVTNVTFKTNEFIFENKKSFEHELEAAECLAKANVKQVVDCTYNIEFDVLTALGEVNALINECLDPRDECKPCEEYSCAEQYEVAAEFTEQTIANPLYARSDFPKCLVLKINYEIFPNVPIH